jgi:hypothetical protein
MRNKPLYRAELSVYDGVQLLRIWDLYTDAAPTMTVTNGAEIVLSELQATLGTLPKLIIYKDSCGEWDRMAWDGKYAAFCSVMPGVERFTDDDTALKQAVIHFKRDQAHD